jgi:hypothetical protein
MLSPWLLLVKYLQTMNEWRDLFIGALWAMPHELELWKEVFLCGCIQPHFGAHSKIFLRRFDIVVVLLCAPCASLGLLNATVLSSFNKKNVPFFGRCSGSAMSTNFDTTATVVGKPQERVQFHHVLCSHYLLHCTNLLWSGEITHFAQPSNTAWMS